MFNEEWELLTEPSLLEQAPLLNLSGMATKVDEYVEKVEAFEKEFEFDLGKLHDNDVANEESTPQESTVQNTTDPLLMQKQFEAINEHTGLYFTQSVYDSFQSLYNLVTHRLKKQGTPDNINEFSMEIEYIEELIDRI